MATIGLNLLGVKKTVMKIKFREVREYAGELERMLINEAQQLEARAVKRSALMDQEASQEYLEECAQDLAVYEDAFPRILRYSLFTHAYAIFEHELAGLAQYYKRVLNLALSPADLTGKGVRQSRMYLKKVAGVPFPDTAPSWNEILTLGQIRNLVVHRTGAYPEKRKDQAIDALIKRWGDAISVDDGRTLQLSAAFIPRLLDTLVEFSEVLFAALSNGPSV